ncbi:hypothetical protein BBJ28_00019907 [Nothophytophthora sp. Chile5]|nr:hypothetical protein BBJ28_00019907 [Nothophytophthora sp. Chile5]
MGSASVFLLRTYFFGATSDFSPPTLETIARWDSYVEPVARSMPRPPSLWPLTLLLAPVCLHRCVDFVHEQVDVNQKTTYVHCKAGRGRSTVVVVAFLIQHRGMTLDEAFMFVKSKRSHVSLHPKQRRILREFSESNSSASSSTSTPPAATSNAE